MKTELVDITTLAVNFPEGPTVTLPRANVLEMIEERFGPDCNTVLLEGREGLGKTETLRQFCQKHNGTAIAVFLKPHSSLPNSEAVISESVKEQAQFLDSGQIDTNPELNTEWLALVYRRLSRRSKQAKKCFYVIIDGLFEQGSPNQALREYLWSILPIGFDGMRFVFSVDRSSFTPQLPNHCKPLDVTLPTLTSSEADALLSDVVGDANIRMEVVKSFFGYPGPIARVRRLLQDQDQEIAADRIPLTLTELLRTEWRTVDFDSELDRTALGVVAFDNTSRSVSEISAIAKLDEGDVRTVLSIPPLTISSETDRVAFVSEAHREFLRSELASEQRTSISRIIEYLQARERSSDSVLSIASYLNPRSDGIALLDHLSAENLVLVAEGVTSTYSLREMVNNGLAAASNTRRLVSTAKFSLLGAAVESLSKYQPVKYRLQLLVLTGHEDKAFAMANALPLPEDTLLACSEIIKVLVENNRQIPDEVVDGTKRLIAEVETKMQSGKAVTIGANLMYLDPDISTTFLRRVLGKNQSGNTLDSVVAMNSLSSDSDQMTDDLSADERLADASSNPDNEVPISELTDAIGVALSSFSASELLLSSSRITDTADRLFLFRIWCSKNRDSPDAIDVSRAGLRHLVDHPELIATSTVLYDLAKPLPHASESSDILRLVRQFDAQAELVKEHGPLEDHVRLLLALARAVSIQDPLDSVERFVNCYLFTNDIVDSVARFSGLASMLSSIHSTTLNSELEAREGLPTLVSEELELLQTEVLASSADQYSALSRAIISLTKVDSLRAIDLAEKLNTRARRDHAFADIITYQISRPEKLVDWTLIRNSVDRINSNRIRDSVILSVARSLELNQPDLNSISWLVGKIAELQKPANRVEVASHLVTRYSASGETAKDDKTLSNLERQVFELSSKELEISGSSETILSAAAILHRDRPDLSKLLVEKAFEKGFTRHEAVSNSYLNAVRFSIRSAYGLAIRECLDNNDLESVKDLIEFVPDKFLSTLLWSELGLCLFSANLGSQAKEICNERIIPSLELLLDEDGANHALAVVNAAPTLYHNSNAHACELINRLPVEMRDQAYIGIITHKLSDQFPWDPFPLEPSANKLSSASIQELLSLIRNLSDDHSVYAAFARITRSLSGGGNTPSYTRSMRNDIANELAQIARDKLPDNENIQHEGYLICAQARIQQIRGGKFESTFWDDLLARTKNIPNEADRAFVAIEIAGAIRPQSSATKFKDYAFEAASAISNEIDRIDRLSMLAHEFWSSDARLARECLVAISTGGARATLPSGAPSHRRAVEIAFRIDRDLASQIAAALDDDPARPARVNSDLMNYLFTLDLEKELFSNATSAKLTEVAPSDLPEVCWKLLGDLNESKIAPISPHIIRRVAERAASLESTAYYPIGALLVENAIQAVSGSNRAPEELVELHRTLVECAHIIASFENAGLDNSQTRRSEASDFHGAGYHIVEPGDRTEALKICRQWLSQHLGDSLRICDPYFTPSDLVILKWILEVNPSAKVEILMSKQNTDKLGQSEGFLEACNEAWKNESLMDPPETTITILSYRESNQAPIHDRAWLSDDAGIRFGTSFNSLGKDKVSDMTLLSEHQFESLSSRLSGYFDKSTKFDNSKRLNYITLIL